MTSEQMRQFMQILAVLTPYYRDLRITSEQYIERLQRFFFNGIVHDLLNDLIERAADDDFVPVSTSIVAESNIDAADDEYEQTLDKDNDK